jgi:hypothetical protein
VYCLLAFVPFAYTFLLMLCVCMRVQDTFIEQLCSGAKAVVDECVSKGVVDPKRVSVGGREYKTQVLSLQTYNCIVLANAMPRLHCRVAVTENCALVWRFAAKIQCSAGMGHLLVHPFPTWLERHASRQRSISWSACDHGFGPFFVITRGRQLVAVPVPCA